MYPIYKKVLSSYTLLRCFNNRNLLVNYFNGIPYANFNNDIVSIENQSLASITDSLIKMLHTFGIFTYWVNFVRVPQRIISRDIKNGLDLKQELINCIWKEKYGGCIVYMINDFPLYDKTEEKLNRLLLMLLIDPLAFISRMRYKINESSIEVQTFFSVLEDSIDCTLQKYVIKYFLIKQLEYDGIVGDIVELVIGLWVCSEIRELEKS